MFVSHLKTDDDFNGVPISYSYFNKVWRRKLNHIKARKAIRFSKCEKCVKLKEKLARTLDEETVNQTKRALFNHISRMELDRRIYQKNKEQASNYKDGCLSIAIDGADFQRYGLPYFCQSDKDSNRGFKNPIRTVGAIVHGHGNMFFTFPANLPSDSNCIIHCLHQLFVKMKKIYERNQKQLPDTLYLQVISIFDIKTDG